jgi:hypothetical protein
MAKRRRKSRRTRRSARRQSLAALSYPAPIQVYGPQSGGTLGPARRNGGGKRRIIKLVLALAALGGAGFAGFRWWKSRKK